MVGITSYSSYIPRLRLDRAKITAAWGTSQAAGEIAVANYDEDALTMGIEAVQACVGDRDSQDFDGLYFASTSAPYREKQMAGLIATVCDLPRRCQSADFAGSVRSGVSAILAAANAVGAGARRRVIVTAADSRVAQPESEMEGLLGDAAAAVVIGGGDDILAEIVDSASFSEEFTHLWRTDDESFVQSFAGRFSNSYGYGKDLGAAIKEVLERQKLEPKAIAKLALYSPDARAAADLAKEIGFDPKKQLVTPAVNLIGSAGSADALLALASALDTANPGDLILVGSYGEGADVILLRATARLSSHRAPRSLQHGVDAKLPLASYEKYLKFRRIFDLEEPGEAINNVLEFQELKQDTRLYGSRCQSCSCVQYPRARVCIACKAQEQMVDHKLAKSGAIFTFTIDQLITNMEHPLPMAVIDLDGGGRLYLQVTDFLVSEVEIGRPVVLTYRRLHEGGGNHNYYWKARPVR